jgi:hypothetical protein
MGACGAYEQLVQGDGFLAVRYFFDAQTGALVATAGASDTRGDYCVGGPAGFAIPQCNYGAPKTCAELMSPADAAAGD